VTSATPVKSVWGAQKRQRGTRDRGAEGVELRGAEDVEKVGNGEGLSHSPAN